VIGTGGQGIYRKYVALLYWRLARGTNFLKELAKLKPELVTTPNYSLFVNSPREDNLHNMKRIAICWHELASVGIPAALHVNARTDADWARWGQFVTERPEISALAFEFATGAVYSSRARWHIEHLCKMADEVGRKLQLIIRGDQHAKALRQSFEYVTAIDTSLYIKSMRRQKIVSNHGEKPRWIPTMTMVDEPLDRLFHQNFRGKA
jgi:hypothetical protein